MNTYSKTALINAAALGAFAIGTALILGVTFTATKDPIAESQRRAEEKALLQVIGEQDFDNDLLNDLVPLNSELKANLNTQQESARVIRNNGELIGFILPTTAPDGYSGAINLIVGLDTQGQLLGVRVVNHKETPGLGDKIDTKKSDWILQFKGRSLQNPDISKWAVTVDGGQFDAFTGATITPRAVVNKIKAALTGYDKHRDELIELANKTQEAKENDH